MITFKQYMSETTLKIGGNPEVQAKKAKAKEWIEKMYKEYQENPMDGRQHVMVWEKDGEQELGIFELQPSMTKPGAVDVKWFQAYPMRQGVGSKAMTELKRHAKEDGIMLTLYPWDKGRVSQASLIKFYKKMGFKPTTKGSKDMFWDPVNEGASLTDSYIIDKMKAAFKRQPHMNCKLAVQMVIGVAKVTDLPKVDEAKLGDVLAYDIHHYAIKLGGDKVVDVAEWEAGPEVHSLKDLEKEYGDPTAIYRPEWKIDESI